MITDKQLQEMFAYHTPRPEQIPQYEAIRAGGLGLARLIMENTPACADQTAAIRKLREAIMTANAAIALGGLV